MKTQIIISRNWEIIKEYSFILHLVPGDVVEWKDREYTVEGTVLDIKENILQILIA